MSTTATTDRVDYLRETPRPSRTWGVRPFLWGNTPINLPPETLAVAVGYMYHQVSYTISIGKGQPWALQTLLTLTDTPAESEQRPVIATRAVLHDSSASDVYWCANLSDAPQDVDELPKALSARLDQIARLSYNWNSYGAPPIDPRAIARARTIISRACRSAWFGLPTPSVAPGSHGGLGIEWQTELGKELILDISPDGLTTYLLVLPGPHGEEEREGVIQTSQDLDDLLQYLKG